MSESISVVIPTFNDWDTIERALSSVANQSILPKELIIIDDGSSKEYLIYLNTLKDVFSGFPFDIQLLSNNSNNGPSWSRNRGWNLSSGDFVAFLDADDAWHPDKLKTQLEIMLQTGCDVSGVGAAQLDDLPLSKIADTLQVHPYGIDECTLMDFLFRNKFTTTSSVMLLRSLPFRFDEKRKYSEDYLLWLLLLANGYRFIFLNTPMTYYFKAVYGNSGLSSSIRKMGVSELSNYVHLYRAGKINIFLFVMSCVFSSIKLFRRMILNVFH